MNHIHIILLTETLFTNNNNFHIRGDTFYRKVHLDCKANGRTNIFIKDSINHHFHPSLAAYYLQATSITLQSHSETMTIEAV